MWWLDNVLFFLALFAGTGAFAYQVWQISKVIRRGKPFDLNTTTSEKIKNLFVYAILQKKMFKYPPVGIMHILTVAGFFIINLEMIEIIVEALTETKRPFQYVLGEVYPIFIAALEILAVIVAFAMLFFLFRRLVIKVPRLNHPDLDKKSHFDANMILVAVFFLMVFILLMDAADYALFLKGEHTYAFSLPFLVTSHIAPFLTDLSVSTLHFLERLGWWGHN
ncbi:MAG: Fe-S oxidoreductase, partial [Chlorobi bacterium]|nr:Fe-S oxidoreductase [Chlorobiota bacterium]